MSRDSCIRSSRARSRNDFPGDGDGTARSFGSRDRLSRRSASARGGICAHDPLSGGHRHAHRAGGRAPVADGIGRPLAGASQRCLHRTRAVAWRASDRSTERCAVARRRRAPARPSGVEGSHAGGRRATGDGSPVFRRRLGRTGARGRLRRRRRAHDRRSTSRRFVDRRCGDRCAHRVIRVLHDRPRVSREWQRSADIHRLRRGAGSDRAAARGYRVGGRRRPTANCRR